MQIEDVEREHSPEQQFHQAACNPAAVICVWSHSLVAEVSDLYIWASSLVWNSFWEVWLVSTWLLQLIRKELLVGMVFWADSPSPDASACHSAQRSARGFPSVFPKLHWFWLLYLGGPGPLVLAVTRLTEKHWVMTAAFTQTQSVWLLSTGRVVFTFLLCHNQGATLRNLSGCFSGSSRGFYISF